MIPPASSEGGDRRIVLETVFKIDKREPEGGTIFVRQKWSPPPPPPPPPPPSGEGGSRREGAGGREAKDHLETVEGEERGDHICQTKVVPPARRADILK